MNEKFMWRALQLASCGEGSVSPNPMVGAVIVADGKIIGEGYHEHYGGPHAEVNAIVSVPENQRHLLKSSTIYVTLEPCAHFGKTPPCANLIVNTGIPEVVIGSPDPNPLVAGKGVRILEEAGVKVIEGILRKECDELNRRFIKAHTSELPWIILKWAQSSDGYMAAIDSRGKPIPVKFSTSLSSVWMHRERANVDTITVGTNTRRIDHPQLDVRLWGGKNPKNITIEGTIDCHEFVKYLRTSGLNSLMVEGGPTLLESFINAGLYDEIRVEYAPEALFRGLKAPFLPKELRIAESRKCRHNIIMTYRR